MAVTNGNSEPERDLPVVGPGLFEDDLRPNIGELADPDEGPVVGLGGKTLLHNGDAVQDSEGGDEAGDLPEHVEDVDTHPDVRARIEVRAERAAADRIAAEEVSSDSSDNADGEDVRDER